MASEQYGAVFGEPQDDDEEPSSSGNDDVLNKNEEEEDEELLEDEGEEFNYPPSLLPPQPIAAVASSSDAVVALAVPSSAIVTVASVPIEEPAPDSKRQRIDPVFAVTPDKKPTQQQPFVDESRRLFQRLWTDEDEIELLKGFLDYTASKSYSNLASSHHHHDTAVFYDLIKSKLQLDFNKSQLVEKLRRLKKKYRNVMSKINSGKDFSFKSPHDQATFEISRKIWTDSVGKVEDNVLDYDENNNIITTTNNSTNINLIDESGEKKNLFPPNSKPAAPKKRSRSKGGKLEEKRVLNDGFVISNNNFNNTSEHDHGNVEGLGGGERGNLPGVIEEAVKSCLTPLFKELLGSLTGGGGGGRGVSGLAMNAMPLSFGGALSFVGVGGVNGELMDERWRKQQILELEVYSKRLELLQDQVKTALEELRSTGR